MRVLVTGASGFVGGRIMRKLVSTGITAVGCSHRPAEGLVTVDVSDAASLSALAKFGPFDHVIHCAGIAHRFGRVTSNEFENVNVTGARNVAIFAAANGIGSFVHLSSVLVYGRHGVGIAEDDPCEPIDDYGLSKLRSEKTVVEIAHDSGFGVTILRPAPVIGEGCKGNFARLMDSIRRGRFVMVGDGSNRKSMVYVEDLADACLLAIGSKIKELRFYNVAAPPVSMDALVAAVRTSLSKTGAPIRIPSHPVRLAAKAASALFPLAGVRSAARSLDTWLSNDVYGTASIRNELGFEPKTSISEAVSRSVAAYLEASG